MLDHAVSKVDHVDLPGVKLHCESLLWWCLSQPSVSVAFNATQSFFQLFKTGVLELHCGSPS